MTTTYITIDSFQQGADLPNNELTQRNHILRDETTGEYYRWDGDLPKQVPAGSTPQSTGGIGKGAWVSVGDASLRSDIKANSGASIIGTESGSSLQSVITKLSKGYLSESDGDLQALVNSVTDVFIDEDVDVETDIIIPSNTSIKTINGAKIHFKGGQFKAPLSTENQYWEDSSNSQIPITTNVVAGSTILKLQSTDGISIGDKLIIKNGYCDLWRVLETSSNPLLAVEKQPYKSEIVTVTAVEVDSVSITRTKYDYPLTPVTYGFLSDENAISRYDGLTRPSVTKILFKNISLDIDVVIHENQDKRIGLFCFTDGISVSTRSFSNSSSSNTALNIRMSDNVEVQDIDSCNQLGQVINIQETCRGSMSNLKAREWRGGSDSPFLAMLMSNISIDNVYVHSSEAHNDASAAYINTCDGGSISNVNSNNTPKVVDFSFSRGIICNDLRGSNADFTAGGYCSVDCSINDGVIDGYCTINSESSIYRNSLVPSAYTLRNTYTNVRRINDEGYGRVLLDNTSGLSMINVQADKTLLYINIKDKNIEIAQEDRKLISTMINCAFGGMLRQSAFRDDNVGPNINYPNVKIQRTRFNGLVNTGNRCNPFDEYDVHTDTGIQVGSECFGVTFSGYAKKLTIDTSVNKFSCIPRISNLRLSEKVVSDSFISVDSTLSTPGATIGNFYDNGAIVTDVYNRSEWVNIGTRGNVKWQKR